MDLQDELDEIRRQSAETILIILNDFLTKVARMRTAEEIAKVSQQRNYFYGLLTPEQSSQLKEAILTRLQKLGVISEHENQESLKILTELGFVEDTRQWLTIKRYAQKYHLDPAVVTT